MTQSTDKFNVCIFFDGGHYEYVRNSVSAQEAFDAFKSYSNSPGAILGTTQRVIITDGGDCINAEWIFGKGIVYPPQTVVQND